MAHDIELTDGKANIAFAGATPWHRLGQQLDSAFDAETALREANLDWEVEVAPLYYQQPVEPGHPDYIITDPNSLVASTKGQIVRRGDTGDELGVVGMKYSPLQNREAFGFFDGLFGKDACRYETAGFTGKGERIWLLANMKDQDPIEILPEDTLKQYLLLTNSHDGTYSAMGAFTPIRVVCNNTLTAAVGGMLKDSSTVRVKHVGQVADRLQFAGQILAQAGVFYDEVKHLFQGFAKKQLNGEQTRSYINHALYADNAESKRRDKVIDSVEGLMHTGLGSDIKGVRGTVWGAYNAVTEHVDHVKEYRDPSKRLEASQFGTGLDIKRRALTEGASLVGYGEAAVALN
jgi:phage/plasmid-like protein (TIGR03299 family)